jgi:hypothetical protein
MEDKIVKKSVAFAKQDIGVVSAFAKQNGLSFSSALRMIIRRWAGLEDERYRLTPEGKEALKEANGEN